MAAPRKDTCIRGHDLTDPDNIILKQRKVYGRHGIRFRQVRECRGCHRIHDHSSQRRRKPWKKAA